MPIPGVLGPLGHRDFALLWSGQSFSILGNSVNAVTLPWQVLQLTGSAAQMGIVVAINLATGIVFLLLAGAIVDRVPRRRILLLSDLTSGIVFSAIAMLSANGVLRIEHLYAATVITGAAQAFFGPAMTAVIPELVPSDVLQAGNALRSFSRQGGRIFGPVLGGVLVATAGLPSAFAFDALTFFVSFGALVAMRSAPKLAQAHAGLFHAVREGIGFVLARGWLWVTIGLASVLNAFLIGALTVALPVELKEVLGVDATTFGIVFAAQGVGEAGGALLVARLRTGHSGLMMWAFTAFSGIAMLAFAAPMIQVLVAAGALYGGSLIGFGILWESALQKHVPRELLGRVSSVDWFGSLVLSPIGPLAAAVLVSTYGPQPVFIAAGLLTIASVPVALLSRSIRELE